MPRFGTAAGCWTPLLYGVSAYWVVKDIRRATRKRHSSEEKIHIGLRGEGLRGEDSIADRCRREGLAQSLYYSWSKEVLEAGKRRLAGDSAREASAGVLVEVGKIVTPERGCS